MSKKFISVDSGGTKTLGIIYDEAGNEVKSFTTSQSNFAVNLDNAKNEVQKVLDELTLGQTIDMIVIGAAGYSRIPDIKAYEKALEERYQTTVKIYPDAYLGLYANYDDKYPFIYQVAGTGSISYAIYEGNVHRFGGYGHIFGDYGSAYSVSIRLLNETMERIDALKKPNSVQKKVLKQLGLKTREEIIGFAHKETKQVIAGIARLIDQESTQAYVQKLYLKEAKVMLSMIEKIIKTLKIKDTFKLVLRGGFIQNANGLKGHLLNLLNQKNINFLYETGTHEPVYGGYNLARAYMRRDG